MEICSNFRNNRHKLEYGWYWNIKLLQLFNFKTLILLKNTIKHGLTKCSASLTLSKPTVLTTAGEGFIPLYVGGNFPLILNICSALTKPSYQHKHVVLIEKKQKIFFFSKMSNQLCLYSKKMLFLLNSSLFTTWLDFFLNRKLLHVCNLFISCFRLSSQEIRGISDMGNNNSLYITRGLRDHYPAAIFFIF